MAGLQQGREGAGGPRSRAGILAGHLLSSQGFSFASGHQALGASLVAQTVKSLPAMRETRVRFLGWEDPLEKGKAAHSSILAWRIPWTKESGGLQA